MLLSTFIYIIIIKFSAVFSDSYIVHSNRSSDDYVPCERGWYYFRDKCYTVEGKNGHKRLSWTRALDKCREYGADLVSIQSEEEQNFIIAFLLLEDEYISWIGLNDRDNESVFTWSDGSALNYTNWYPGEPSGLGQSKIKEDCVYMYLNPIGKWNDASCDYADDYICEMESNPEKRSPNLMYCSSAEGGGFKYQNSCYHIVTELKSWQDAETYCRSTYNGHLLYLQDKKEDIFLEYASPDTEKETWIGIKIQSQLQQKWSSGWYVLYNKFSKEEKYVEDTCVARKNLKEWITVPCSRQLPFICKVSKEIPPVLKPPPAGSYCPMDVAGWRDFGGDYCYYIDTETKVNFTEARSSCQGRGGDLVSLHSQEEAEILHAFIKYLTVENTGEGVYIGLIRKKGIAGQLFGWTDGSMLDYRNWDSTEPNRIEEECVTALILTMKWRDVLCSSKESGYICSIKKIMPSPVENAKSIVNEVTAGCSSHTYLKIVLAVSICMHMAMSLLGVLM